MLDYSLINTNTKHFCYQVRITLENKNKAREVLINKNNKKKPEQLEGLEQLDKRIQQLCWLRL